MVIFRVGANVVAIGTTSLMTDVSSVMVNAIIPLYLVFHQRRFSARVRRVQRCVPRCRGHHALSAMISDRKRRHKEVAAAGLTSHRCVGSQRQQCSSLLGRCTRSSRWR